MKKRNILLGLGVSLLLASCTSNGIVDRPLKTKVDSVSYGLGLDMAFKIKNGHSEIDKNLFLLGYSNGIDSTGLKIEKKDLDKLLRSYFQNKRVAQMKKQQEEAMKKLEEKYGDNKKEGQEFLANNKSKKGIKTTASGLQYAVIKEGKGERPLVTSRVQVLYKGTLIDGTEFDSALDRKKPAEFNLNGVIRGWTEGLQLMKPGAKYKFYVPQELAYGPQQKGPKIKPFSMLIFEVELLKIVKK